mgnify:CR=1 FL=1
MAEIQPKGPHEGITNLGSTYLYDGVSENLTQGLWYSMGASYLNI